MRKYYAILAALGLAGTSPALAQAPTNPPGRFYVGLGAYLSQFNYVSGNRLGELRVPVQLTAGYQLRPRLAVQLSVAYSHPVFDYGQLTQGDSGGGLANYHEGRAEWRNTTLAVQARYCLRPPARRLQAELLAGLVQQRQQFRDYYHHWAIDSDTQAVVADTYRTGYAEGQALGLTAGLSLGYRWGRHLEAVADGQLLAAPGRLLDMPGLAGSLGLRYRFGSSW